MSQPFVGEIRMFAGNFAPVGWAFCQGQLLAISENDVLFNLIGTTYGGDGQNTFALPNLSSRIPVHVGPGFALGQTAGAESVTLTTSQIPGHSHVPQATNGGGSQAGPSNGLWASSSPATQFSTTIDSGTIMSTDAMGVTGGSQPHDNMVPYLCVNFIISLFGVFPSQS